MRRAASLAVGFAAVAVVCSAAVAQTLPEPAAPSLSELREIRSTYIIELDPSVSPDELEGRARGLAARFNGRVKHVYGKAYHGFAIRMSDAAVARLLQATDTDVIRLTRDDVVSINRPPWERDSGSEEPTGGSANCTQEIGWGVNRITTELRVTEDLCPVKREPLDYYSDTTSVCVLDTGVDYDHEDLNVNKKLARNFAAGKDADDKNGHGTHVAGIIGAKDNHVGVVGVAPNVSIIPIKVLGNGGTGSYADVIAGVDATPGLCAVANMSLGGPVYDPLVKAVRCAAGYDVSGVEDPGPCSGNRVIFTLAAGNESDDAANHSPANASYSREPKEPIYTIAAFGKDDIWASYSNYGGPVDYALPGSGIKSTIPGGYATYSGTSMAAPHMAGLVARGLSNSTLTEDSNLVTLPTWGTDQYTGPGPDEAYPIAVAN